jgi:F420-non-reducing hydrogenase iron-sulfur subunit
MMSQYNFKIVGYICKFCALLSADLGPPIKSSCRLEFIDVPCAGKVDQRLLLAPFEEGADVVFIAGCPEHHCLNIQGSARAGKRLTYMAKLLDEIGVGGNRLMMFSVSGTEGPRFAQIIHTIETFLSEVGPSPLNIRPNPSPELTRETEQSVQKDGEVCA